MWILLALGAGLLQGARNAFARSLPGAISPVLNSLAYVEAVGEGESVAAVAYSLVLVQGSPS